MKKVWNKLCSMRTANILLALAALLCGLSSLVPQGRELPFYAENYPRAYILIYRTHFYNVFSSWYFILLIALLCLSLLLCSARMFGKALKNSREGVSLPAAGFPVTGSWRQAVPQLPGNVRYPGPGHTGPGS